MHNSNHGDQVREIVYTANGEKITNEDSPLRNTDQVQLVGFTTYSNRLGDDGYAIVSFQKTQPVQLIHSSWSLMTRMQFTPHHRCSAHLKKSTQVYCRSFIEAAGKAAVKLAKKPNHHKKLLPNLM